MSIKTHVKTVVNTLRPNLIYDKTTKKLTLQTYNRNTNIPSSDAEASITVLNSFEDKRVVFWLTKYGGRYGVTPGTAEIQQ